MFISWLLPAESFETKTFNSLTANLPILVSEIWMFPKIGGKTPKMDGEHIMVPNPIEQMDDLGGLNV